MLQRLLDRAGIRTGSRVVRLRGGGREARRGGERQHRLPRFERQNRRQGIGLPHFGCHHARNGRRSAARGEGECQ